MQYLALLISKERELTPDERAEGMAAYQSFHAKAALGDPRRRRAVAVGDRRPHHAAVPRRRRSPTARSPRRAEIACGYYVFEAENLDDALALARDIPAAQDGAIEVRPIFHTFDSEWSRVPTPSGWRCYWSRRPRSIPLAHRSGRPKRRGTANSRLPQATTSSAARLCTSRRRRPPCGFATAR